MYIRIRSSLHYHHHILLLESITDLLETKRLVGFHTTHAQNNGTYKHPWKLLRIQDLGDTRVPPARAAMHTRYTDRIGDRIVAREVLKVLVRCMMRMGDVAR